MSSRAASFVALIVLVASCIALAPAAPPLVLPRPGDPVPIADDGLPNPEFRLPPNELSPGEIIVTNDAGDVRDWSHAHVGVTEANKTLEGDGQVVAVLDTGGDDQHRDLKDQIIGGKDFTGSRSGWADVNGHGTWCAGCIAGARNDTGMQGAAPKAKILVVKVLGDRGSGLSTWIAAGIDYAVAWRGPKGERVGVISMSLGGPADARTQAACQRAVAAGVIVCAAAGNDGPREGTVGYPGGFAECVCVAATDDHDRIANFSSRGKAVYLAAPGVNTRNAYPGDRFATMSGTSMATPLVAAHAALWREWRTRQKLSTDPAEYKRFLAENVLDLPPAGRDTSSGFGRVRFDVFAAVSPPPPPPPGGNDQIVFEPPANLPITIGGRRVKRIIWELEPIPLPMPAKKP